MRVDINGSILMEINIVSGERVRCERQTFAEMYQGNTQKSWTSNLNGFILIEFILRSFMRSDIIC